MPGVNLISFEEVELLVGGNESVPLALLVTLGEKQTDVATSKDYVNSNVPPVQESKSHNLQLVHHGTCTTRPETTNRRSILARFADETRIDGYASHFIEVV